MDKLNGPVQRVFAHSFAVVHAPRLDVRFGDRCQGGGGESHLHGLFASAEKLEFELPEEKIDIGHAGAAPAFVQGEGSGGELFEGFGLLRVDFSFVEGGLELGMHVTAGKLTTRRGRGD